VIALALPRATAVGTPFPARDLIIFVTFAVIFVTLVVQGLTLRPLLRLLHVHGEKRNEAEEAHARRISTEKGLHRLGELASTDGVNGDAAELLKTVHERQARHWSARDRTRHGTDDADHRALAPANVDSVEDESSTYRNLRREMIEAERSAIIDLRDSGVIGDEVLRRIQRDLDLETMMLDAADDRPDASPYEAT
jgi:monovalent cation/hydrogen antiporter